MTIDKAIDIMEHYKEYGFVSQANGRNKAIDTMRKYQKLQADYENRLKADLKAMLTDFLMDIEENTSINSNDSHERNGKRLMRIEIIRMFEQKIKSLKEQT